MPALNIFENSAFNMLSLSEHINKLPGVPGRIGAMGLFQTRGITTTSVVVEEKNGKLILVPNTPRGAAPNQFTTGKRKARQFTTTHLPVETHIKADDVQNIRAFGSDNELASVGTMVSDRLLELRQSLEATLEYHRCGAVKGQILDSDGVTLIYDLFTEFGISQPTLDFVLDNNATEVRLKCTAVKRAIVKKLGGLPYDHIHCLCSATFFDALISHPVVKTAYQDWKTGEALRNDPSAEFSLGGIVFEEYSAEVNGVAFIPDDKARVFPVGVPGLFMNYFAPANTMEAANTIGKPFYAKVERLKYDRGVDLLAESNPLAICTIPEVLYEVSI